MVNIIHIAVSAAMATTLAAAYVVSSEQQQSLHDPRIRLSRRSPQPETPQAESKPSEKAAEKPVKTYAQCMADCREEVRFLPNVSCCRHVLLSVEHIIELRHLTTTTVE